MNDLCTDIGYKSINHVGEELCGDHIDIVEEGEDSTVIVLADGLGSGVKASILSTLTSKIISTMMAAGLPLEECVSTIAATLPVCSLRGVAYSTFTIIHILNNEIAEIIQYDNPHVIGIRDYEAYDYPKTETNTGGKKIYWAENTISAGRGKTSQTLWWRWWQADIPQRTCLPCWWTSVTTFTATSRATIPPPASSRSARESR